MCESNVILPQAMSPFRRSCSVFPFRAHPVYYQMRQRGMPAILPPAEPHQDIVNLDAQQSPSSLYVQAIKHNVCICIYIYIMCCVLYIVVCVVECCDISKALQVLIRAQAI